MTEDFMSEPFDGEDLFNKKGKGKAPNVPDTWELIELSNRLNMRPLTFKLLVIIQTRSWTEGYCIPGKEKMLKDLGPRCSMSTLERHLRELKTRGIIKRTRNRKGDGFKTASTRIINFDGKTKRWAGKVWNGEPYFHKKPKNQRVTDDGNS